MTGLGYWRAKRGLTQQQISDRTGVSRNHIAQVERGKGMGLEIAKILARALNCTLDDLVRDYPDEDSTTITG